MNTELDYAFRESGSETYADLQLGRNLMTYKESASDNMPETSQMTRNNTITDFDQSDSEYHSPNVHKDSLHEGSGAGSDDHIKTLKTN